MKVIDSKQRPKVVVVGGSFAGLATMRYLRQIADVTLIEPRDFFEYSPGILHVLSGSRAFSNLVLRIGEVSKDSRVVRGRLCGLSPVTNKVFVNKIANDDEIIEINYDALVLCTGSTYTYPIKTSSTSLSFEERKNDIHAYLSNLKMARSVIILGGGLVGVELAAEIAVRLPTCLELTLVSRGPILATLPSLAGRYAGKWLERHGVKQILGNSVVQWGSQSKEDGKSSCKLSNGDVLHADLIIDCMNMNVPTTAGQELPNTHIQPLIVSQTKNGPDHSNTIVNDKSAVSNEPIWPFDNKGKIVVDRHMRVRAVAENAGVFAAGDVTRIDPDSCTCSACQFLRGSSGNSYIEGLRTAHIAEAQAELCARNVITYLTTTRPSELRLQSYPRDLFHSNRQPVVACVSLGPRDAILIFNNIVLGGFLFGGLAAVAKWIIERSKVAEIQNRYWGQAFWALGHVLVNILHSISEFVDSLWNRIFSSRIRDFTKKAY